MFSVKSIAAFVAETILVLGALACILVWLDIKPKDFSAMTLPHWIWLVAAIVMFSISIWSSVRGLILNITKDKKHAEAVNGLMKQHEQKADVLRMANETLVGQVSVQQGDLNKLRRRLELLKNSAPTLIYAGQLQMLAAEARDLVGTFQEIINTNYNKLLTDRAEMDLARPMTHALVSLSGSEADQLPWQRMRLMSLRDRYSAHRSLCEQRGISTLLSVPNDNINKEDFITAVLEHEENLLKTAREIENRYAAA